MENFKTPIFAPSQLQEMLDEINASDMKMPNKTLFGDLNALVPVPYSKFKTMDNP